MKNLCERKVTYPALTMLMLLGVVACGGGGSSSPATTTTSSSVTYSTTSSKGDYSEWTLSSGALNASWEVVNDTGGIDYTYTIAATCGAVDTDNFHNCTISTASCSDGVASCPATSPSGDIKVMEVPGVALVVQTTASSGGDDLHAGFVKSASACADDVSGDYTYIRTGVGLQENFGIFNADSNMINIEHADFGFDTGATSQGEYGSTLTPSTQTVAYRTGSGGSDTLVDGGCSTGVRARTTSGGDAMRAMMTASGLFILDLPAGQGGFVSFKTSNAASLSDFANKSFGGIVFPDDGAAQPLHASSGALASGKIDLAISSGNPFIDGQTFNIMALTTPSGLVPDYPDFTASPTGYSSNPLASTYPTPNDIPGIFKFGQLFDAGRVIVAAMKFNNKVIAVGMVYNWRDPGFSFNNPSTGNTFAAGGLYNSGNFILFEK